MTNIELTNATKVPNLLTEVSEGCLTKKKTRCVPCGADTSNIRCKNVVAYKSIRDIKDSSRSRR